MEVSIKSFWSEISARIRGSTTQNGSKVVTLSVATSDTWKDKLSGERKERTEWHRVVVFNAQLADVAERYLRKGSKVYIEGQLQTRKWEDANGQEKYTTEVVLQNFSSNLIMLDGRGDAGAGADVFSGSSSASSGWDSAPSSCGSRQKRWEKSISRNKEVPF